MARHLKILGLTLVVAFAMSTVVASTASAAVEFKAESSVTVLAGKQEGAGDIFHADSGNVSCTTISYEGAMVGTSAAEMEIVPSYSGCTAFGFINVPIDVNSCKYKFTSGEERAGNFEGSAHIVCPESKAIEITAPGCRVTVGAQTPTGGTITYTNVGSGTTREITIDLALTGIHYIEDNNGGGCFGPTGTTKTNGTYTGKTIVTGENASEVHHGIWLPVMPSPIEFKMESSQTTVTGSQEGSDVFTTDGGTVTCKTATYVGSVTGTSATEAEVAPTYSGCTAFGFINVPIDLNECKYKFTAGSRIEGNFEGSVHVVCPEGKAVEITAPGCRVTVGAQTPGGTITYTNIGTGTTRELTLDVNVTGVHYTEDNNGGGCVKAGAEKTNGTYTGHTIVTGENASQQQHGIWVE